MKRVLMLVLSLLVAGAAVAADAPTKTRKTTKAAKTTAAVSKDKAIMQIEKQIETNKVDKSKPDWRTTLTKPAVITFETGKSYFVDMKTSKGPILIKLLPDVAPMHVTSFMYLTQLGFYDGLSFHRVIQGFMAQGGCPLGTGTGGPGYEFESEFKPNVKHDKPGLLSMANAGPGTDGSQFFLTFVPTPHLDGKHTIFGEVVEGQGTLRELEARGSQSGRTSEKVYIERATIEVE